MQCAARPIEKIGATWCNKPANLNFIPSQQIDLEQKEGERDPLVYLRCDAEIELADYCEFPCMQQPSIHFRGKKNYKSALQTGGETKLRSIHVLFHINALHLLLDLVRNFVHFPLLLLTEERLYVVTLQRYLFVEMSKVE